MKGQEQGFKNPWQNQQFNTQQQYSQYSLNEEDDSKESELYTDTPHIPQQYQIGTIGTSLIPRNPKTTELANQKKPIHQILANIKKLKKESVIFEKRLVKCKYQHNQQRYNYDNKDQKNKEQNKQDNGNKITSPVKKINDQIELLEIKYLQEKQNDNNDNNANNILNEVLQEQKEVKDDASDSHMIYVGDYDAYCESAPIQQ